MYEPKKKEFYIMSDFELAEIGRKVFDASLEDIHNCCGWVDLDGVLRHYENCKKGKTVPQIKCEKDFLIALINKSSLPEGDYLVYNYEPT